MSADTLELGGDTVSREDCVMLLTEIKNERNYQIPLSLPEDDPKAVLLRTLARNEYIRWCAYPEEFYVLQPKGEAFLAEAGQ